MARIPPMEFLGPAVRQLRKDLRLTLEAVANQVAGYDSGNLSRFERGVQSIDTDKLREIAAILKVSVSEIYSLAEKLERDSATTPAVAHSVSEPSRAYGGGQLLAGKSPTGVQHAVEVQRRPHETPASSAWEFVLIPSIAVVINQNGHAAVEQSDFSQAIPRAVFESIGIPLERARLITVHGDAMASTLCDGDNVLVDVGERTIHSGRVYALLIQDELWVRRIMKTPTGVILSADNKSSSFEDHALALDEFRSTQVIGRVRLRWGSSGL